MNITFFRSSSFSCWSMCQQQYYFQYNLGWPSGSNLAADKGTITHKILEILAIIKKARQDGLEYFDDEIFPGPEQARIDWMKEVDIDILIERVYAFYTKIFNQVWTTADFKDIKKWTFQAIEFGGGMFNPLNRIIVEPERQFNFPILKDWAKYSYEVDGQKVEGHLGLKGTIDLITQVDDKVYEIIDWKTGARKDWATGAEKDQSYLQHDAQLMIYFYAASQLYPDIEQIIITINFIRSGGPFTVIFTKDDLIKTEEMLKERFDVIRKTQKPKLVKDADKWKCTKFCHFGKNTFKTANTGILPIVEFRNGQTCRKGTEMTMCEQIKFEIERKGLDKVTKEYTKKGHQIGYYQAPGG